MIIENETKTGATVAFDDKQFINCRYTDCTIIYGGGDSSWANTYFKNCKIQLVGSAQRTVGFLANFGLAPVPQQQPVKMPEPTSGVLN